MTTKNCKECRMKKPIIFLLTLMTPLIAFAQDGGGSGYLAIGAALAIGLAAFGGALGQGKAAAAALDGYARNPAASGKFFLPFILSLVFVESLVIFSLLIAFTLAGKI